MARAYVNGDKLRDTARRIVRQEIAAAKLRNADGAAAAGAPARVRIAPTEHGGHELIAPFGIAWETADGITHSLTSQQASEAAGAPAGRLRSPAAAALDQFPWSHSLGSFLAAIGDPGDSTGARAIVSRVMEEHRPRAAAGMAERVPSEGGYLVPQRLVEQIETFMTGAVIVPRAKYVPMDSLRVAVPLLDNADQSDGILGGMTFSMTKEGAAITATTPQFGVLALEARKFMGYLASVPNELVDDAPTFSEQFLPEIVGRGLAWQEDFLCVNGTGVGEPQGLLNAPAALLQVRAASDTVGVADLVGMLKQLHPQSKRSKSTVWLVGDDLFGALLELATITGTTPTSAASGPELWLTYDSAAGYWRLLGYPCFPTDWQPALGDTGDAILVDLSLYLWGDRGAMTVERSQKGSGFVSGTSNFRFRHRIDGRYWAQSPYTLANGQTASPLIILAEAA